MMLTRTNNRTNYNNEIVKKLVLVKVYGWLVLIKLIVIAG